MTEADEAKMIRVPCMVAVFGQLVLVGGALSLIFLDAPASWLTFAACIVVAFVAHIPLARADSRLTAERNRKHARFLREGPDWS